MKELLKSSIIKLKINKGKGDTMAKNKRNDKNSENRLDKIYEFGEFDKKNARKNARYVVEKTINHNISEIPLNKEQEIDISILDAGKVGFVPLKPIEEINKTSKFKKVIIKKNDKNKEKDSNKRINDAIIKDHLLTIITINKRLIIAIIPIFIVIIMVVAILSQSALILTTKVQKANFEQKLNETILDMTSRFSQVNAKFIDERVRKILSQNDLYVYTNSFWKYELVANGTVVKNDKISIKALNGKVIIELLETHKPSELPDSIISTGSVTRGDEGDNLLNHIKIFQNNTKGDVIKKTNTTIVQFNKTSLKSGDKIIVEISDQLGSKLNLPYSQITIDIK